MESTIYPIVFCTNLPKAPVSESRHYFFVFDRSGSMFDILETLVNDLIAHINQLPRKSIVSVLWFSGEREYDTIVDSIELYDDSSYKTVSEEISKAKHTVGLTCFSEVLGSLVVDKTSDSVLVFFTDGYPVVSNYEKEINAIFDKLPIIDKTFSAKLFIGYGSYYNRELLIEMSTAVGGIFVHNSTLKDTRKTISEMLSLSPRVFTAVKTDNFDHKYIVGAGGALENGNVVIYQQKSEILYIVDCARLVLLIRKDDGYVGDIVSPVPLIEQDYYVATSILINLGKIDEACRMLAYMGDKYFVDHILNSFTVEEYGKVLGNLKDAISDVPFSRYRNGRCKACIPEDNAYCFFDVIKLLMTDPDACFYPLHPDWKYKRIGKKAERKDNDGLVFSANDKTAVKFNKLVWHSTRLNLSVQAKIEGTVDLTDIPIKISDIAEVQKVITDLGEENMKSYPTFQYRNYTLVENGHYNVKNLYITASENVIVLLKLRNLITPTDDEKIFKLEFEDLPVINRNIAKESKMSANMYARLSVELLKCKANMKVYRKFSKENEESKIEESKVSQFLLKSGFRKDGSFEPQKVVATNDNCDYHIVNALEVKIQGCSTLPNVDSVIKKKQTNKKLKISDELISNAIDSIGDRDLDTLIKETKELMLTINHQLNRCKFGLLMSKQWFEDFNTIENPVVVVPLNERPVNVTFVLAKENVYFN